MLSDVEALAEVWHDAYEWQYDECDHDTYSGGPLHGQPYRMCVIQAKRILTSDWLAAHDEQVRREERERIAQAIEALEEQSKTHSAGQWSKDGTVTRHALTYAYAARIARQEQGEPGGEVPC